MNNRITVTKFEHGETNFIVTYREKGDRIFDSCPPEYLPDYIREETWEVVDGKLKMTGCRKGRVIPVPASEQIKWDKYEY